MTVTGSVSIFLVEDDVKLTELIKEYLESHHFIVSTENDGNRAVERILAEKPALVILDIMLPGKDGRTVCRELRDRYNGPIMMLTVLKEEVDQILGLEIGADDYLTKPVRPRLLLSRIKAILRFGARSAADAPESDSSDSNNNNRKKIVVGNIAIHVPNRTVVLDGQPVDLTTIQFDLLLYLAQRAGQIVSRNELFQHLWGIDYDGLNRSVDVTIVRIREKIGDYGKDPQIIKSIRGEGYLMVSS